MPCVSRYCDFTSQFISYNCGFITNYCEFHIVFFITLSLIIIILFLTVDFLINSPTLLLIIASDPYNSDFISRNYKCVFHVNL